MRIKRILGAMCLCGLSVLWADAAFAQARSASRHGAQDRLEQQTVLRDRIAALYDRAEMEKAMELGNGSLRGVMGISDEEGVGGLLSRVLRGKSVALADREWVFVLPMTAHVEAWFEANNQDTRPVAGEPVGGLNPNVWKYAGRARTDSEGNFSLDGLKPGRYLVVANFPISFTGSRQVETGSYSLEYSYSPMYGSGTGTIKPVTRTERTEHEMNIWVSEVVDVRPNAATRFSPPTRDLF